MKTMRAILTAALLTLAAAAGAQTLAEVTLTTAIMSDLAPGVRFPTGSFRAVGAGADRFVAGLPGTEGFASWEVYTATGLAARLQPAFVRDVTTSLAVAGYFEAERTERTVGDETHTRILFSDGASEALLYVVTRDDAVIWAIGRRGG